MRSASASASAALCVVVLASIGAACGEKPVDAAQVLASAPDKTLDASTARIAVDVSVKTDGKTVKLHEEGVTELSGRSAALSLDASQFGLEGIDGDIEARFLHGVFYADFGPVFRAAGDEVPPAFAHKRWLRLDLSKTLEGAAAANGNDPSSFTSGLQYLRAADKDGIEELGEADVRGEHTTRYRVEVDVPTLRKRLRAAKISSDVRRATEKSFDTIDGDTIRTDVWVDDDGLVRRQHLEMAMHVKGQAMTMRITTELFGFGVTVHVVEPPADEVFDLNDLMGATTSA
jgi:hypothetical protein